MGVSSTILLRVDFGGRARLAGLPSERGIFIKSTQYHMYTYIYTKLDINKWVYLAPVYCE